MVRGCLQQRKTMEPFAQTINAAKKYVVSRTLKQPDWNAELLHDTSAVA